MVSDEVLQRMDARLERLEAAVERLTGLLDKVPAQLAMATDIADDWVRERGGLGVEQRLVAVEQAVMRISAPETFGALVRIAELAPGLETSARLVARAEDHVAMATDIADDWVAQELGGAAVEARLDAGRHALGRLSEPAVLAALTQIACHAPALERWVGLAARLDEQLAMATDIADDWVREAVGGEGVEARLAVGAGLLVRLTEPAVLQAVTRLVERAPGLERLAGLAASFDDYFGMATDMLDDWVRDDASGFSVERRLEALHHAALALSRPDVLAAGARLVDNLPNIQTVLDSAESLSDPAVQAALVELARLAPSLVPAARTAAALEPLLSDALGALGAPVEPVTAWGLVQALRDPSVQRGLGRALHVTRHLGDAAPLVPARR
jgi:hypothetical protein